jgi:hypothetical protein
MSAIGRVLLPSMVFALIPSALVWGAIAKVEYVGGTVQSIPANAVGSLNFDDARDLQFNYSGSVYKLPYEQITSTDVTRTELRRVHRIPVPALLPNHWKNTLTISYKDSAGTTGTVKFVKPMVDASEARQRIADKKAPPGETSATTQDNNLWWGDKYWKTNRNKPTWDDQNRQSSESAQTAPGDVK